MIKKIYRDKDDKMNGKLKLNFCFIKIFIILFLIEFKQISNILSAKIWLLSKLLNKISTLLLSTSLVFSWRFNEIFATIKILTLIC